jgi:hypothetical protein
MSQPATLERRMPGYRYGIVLLLLFATFVVMATGTTSSWSRLVIVVLQSATLFAALAASRVSARVMHLMWIVGVCAVGGTIASIWWNGDSARGAAFLLNAGLVAIAPIAIGRALVRRREIDIQTVLGAICVYVLVGMLWSFVYAAMAEFGSQQFFVQQANATPADTLYFSFVTLTTTGYGDFTAATGLGRAFAVLEALLGQIYLVTVVSVLVSQLGRVRSAPAAVDAPSEPS